MLSKLEAKRLTTLNRYVDADIIAYVSNGLYSAVNVLVTRKGIMQGDRHIVLVLNLVDRFFKVFGGISFSHLQKSGFIALFCQGYFNAFFKLFLKIILQKLFFAELLADNFGRYFVVLIILNDKYGRNKL